MRSSSHSKFRAAGSRWKIARRLSAAGFLGILVAASLDLQGFAVGNLAAIDWLGFVHVMDPLAATENLIARRSLQPEVLLGGGILVLLSAFVIGRAFCSWVCPLGLLLDLNDAVRRRFRRKEKYLHPGSPKVKYWVLYGLLVFTAFSGVPVFQAISPIHYLTWLALFAVTEPAVQIWAASLPLVFLMALEWKLPRFWCRVLCPLGAFYATIGRWSLWKIRIGAVGVPLECGRCTRGCSMGIAVMEAQVQDGHRAIDDPECTRCGDCVDVCPQGRLGQAFPC